MSTDDVDTFHILDMSISNSEVLPRNANGRISLFFTGLKHRMLIFPYVSISDLLHRPGLYLKSDIKPAAAIFVEAGSYAWPSLAALIELEWMANSYIFEFLSSPFQGRRIDKSKQPIYFIDTAGRNIHNFRISDHYDNTHIWCRESVATEIESSNLQHTKRILELAKHSPDLIKPSNYAETSFSDETITYNDAVRELVNVYIASLAENSPEKLDNATLTGSSIQITCANLYNSKLLSLYMSAIREPRLRQGTRINTFKNFYNIIEYYMAGEGASCLTDVLKSFFSVAEMQALFAQTYAELELALPGVNELRHGENHGAETLPGIVETNPDIIEKVGQRIYYKRNAALHSKKTFRGAPALTIMPGPDESKLLGEIIIMRPIVEAIIRKAALTD